MKRQLDFWLWFNQIHHSETNLSFDFDFLLSPSALKKFLLIFRNALVWNDTYRWKAIITQSHVVHTHLVYEIPLFGTTVE